MTFSELYALLEIDKLVIEEVSNRLSLLMVQYKEYNKQKPVHVKLKNSITNKDAFYLLPTKLLAACITVLVIFQSSKPGN